MMDWSVQDVAHLLSGEWLAEPDAAELSTPIAGVSIDSRTIKLGEVFIAINGERFDGSVFVAEALNAGASMAVVMNDCQYENTHNKAILRVDDTIEALWTLARAHRARLDRTRVIAVTGSNGKTTTCRLLDAVLSRRYSGTASPRSFNNHIGAPLTILGATPMDDYLICEIGSSAPGEIASLAGLVKPDIGVITNIGRAHLGGFGSVEAIAREKASLAYAVAVDGLVLAPTTPELLDDLLVSVNAEIRRIGVALSNNAPMANHPTSARADVAIVSIEHVRHGNVDLLCITLGDGGVFSAPIIGRHNAGNIACAVTVARWMGMDDDSIRDGLLAAELPSMRLERMTIAGVEIFNDAYNASPESMEAAMAAFAELSADAGQRILVLGDMLELGEGSTAAHREVIARAVAESGFDRIIVVGSLMAEAAREAPGDPRLSAAADPTDAAILSIALELKDGDSVLLKGSRLMRLERVVDALKERTKREVSPSTRG